MKDRKDSSPVSGAETLHQQRVELLKQVINEVERQQDDERLMRQQVVAKAGLSLAAAGVLITVMGSVEDVQNDARVWLRIFSLLSLVISILFSVTALTARQVAEVRTNDLRNAAWRDPMVEMLNTVFESKRESLVRFREIEAGRSRRLDCSFFWLSVGTVLAFLTFVFD